jgi:NADH dehydrogenase
MDVHTDHVERALERAARATDPDERAAWSRFAVVGGGRTGVELARRIAQLARRNGPARVSLLAAGPCLLPGAGRELAALGVDVWLRASVVGADEEGIDLAGDLRIPARTVIWSHPPRAPEHVTI